MKLKKILSLTTALLMTAAVAAGVSATKDVAGINPAENTIAILDGDLKTAKEFVRNEVNEDGSLKEDHNLTLGIYVYSSNEIGSLTIPISFKNFDEDSISVDVPARGIKDGHAFGDQDSYVQGGIYYGEYNNGSQSAAGIVTSDRDGVKAYAAVASTNSVKKPLNPSTPDNLRRYKNADGNWVNVSEEDTYFAQFTVKLKAGIARGAYEIVFDTTKYTEGANAGKYTFFIFADQANIDLSAKLLSYTVYVGEEAPQVIDPSKLPNVVIGDPANKGADGYVPIAAEDRARKFLDASGESLNSIPKNAAGDRLDLSQGFAVVKVPVLAKNAIPIIGGAGYYQITGPDASQVVIDSTDRFELDETGFLDKVSNPVSKGLHAINATVTAASTPDSAESKFVVVYKDAEIFDYKTFNDGDVMFNLQFIVALKDNQQSYSFDVQITNFEWSIGDTNTGDPTVYKVNGEDYQSNSEPKTINLGVAPVVTTTSLAPGSTTSRTTTTRRGGNNGNNGGDVTSPPTGDSGVVGVIATVGVLGLAGAGIYLAKKRRDDE